MSAHYVKARKKDLPQAPSAEHWPHALESELFESGTSATFHWGVLILQYELSQAENEPDTLLSSLNKVFTIGATN